MKTETVAITIQMAPEFMEVIKDAAKARGLTMQDYIAEALDDEDLAGDYVAPDGKSSIQIEVERLNKENTMLKNFMTAIQRDATMALKDYSKNSLEDE